MFITGNDGYQNFLVFAPMFSSIILAINEKVINWISTGISSENIKQFDNNLEPTMSNLANGRVIFKYNNPVLVQKSSSSLYSNFILNLYIAYESRNWPRDPTNKFPLKNCLFGIVNLVRNALKSIFI